MKLVLQIFKIAVIIYYSARQFCSVNVLQPSPLCGSMRAQRVGRPALTSLKLNYPQQIETKDSFSVADLTPGEPPLVIIWQRNGSPCIIKQHFTNRGAFYRTSTGEQMCHHSWACKTYHMLCIQALATDQGNTLVCNRSCIIMQQKIHLDFLTVVWQNNGVGSGHERTTVGKF